MGGGGKTLRVALLIESSRTYGRGILRGIAKYAHLRGHWSCFTEERELHSGIPVWLQKWKGHGIIARIEDRRMARRLLRLGLPVVDVLGNARFRSIPTFDTDAQAAARMAADFFLRAGFRHFAFCGYRDIPFSDRRAEAFADYLKKHDRKVRVFSTVPAGHLSLDIQAVEQRGLEREQAIAAWVRKQPRPLALFACNDVCAQQVLNACREHGIKVPEEVAVVGVDNDDVLCQLCEPPLTSIEPDTEGLGYAAAALLDRLMRGQRKSEPDGPCKIRVSKGHRIFSNALALIPPLRMVERASADAVAVEDPIAVQAVRYIRGQLDRGIAVKDVLAHVSRSRTDMEQRFRRWLGCSIHDEIVRRRLDRACTLLQQTDLQLEEVARRAGFSTTSHLCRLFQNSLRQTPTEYRRSQRKG